MAKSSPRSSKKSKINIYVEFDLDPKDPKSISYIYLGESLKALNAHKARSKKAEKEPRKKEKKPAFIVALEDFTKAIDSLQKGSALLRAMQPAVFNSSMKETFRYCETHGKKISTRKNPSFVLTPNRWKGFSSSIDHTRDLAIFFKQLPAITLLGLVSTYDGLLHQLLHAVFEAVPEIIESSEKTMTYKEIIKGGGFEKAREFIIAKEVETVLRDSHQEHFNWLTKRIGIKLTENLEAWPRFVEICERRNLITHNGGIVTEQYLKNCKASGFKVDEKIKKGAKLGISPNYLSSAITVFHEIGLKLTYVIWRKVQPTEIENADSEISQQCYDLIKKKKLKLAIRILEFTSQCKDVKDSTLKMMAVNLANAYKLSGDKAKAVEILGKTDWSATADNFQISVAAVLDEHDKAAALMRQIGAEGNVAKEDYHEWPVFKDFRESEPFKTTYKSIFKVDYESDAVAIESATEISVPTNDLNKIDITSLN